MELLRSGGVRILWDHEMQAAVLTLDPAVTVDYGEENTRRTLDALERIVRQEGRLRLVVAMGRSEGLTVACTMRWLAFLARHAPRVHLVAYDVPPSLHGLIALVRRVTPARFDLAHDADDARRALAPLTPAAADP